jgi:hypothetical protein
VKVKLSLQKPDALSEPWINYANYDVRNRVKARGARENESDEYISLGVDADEGRKYGEAAAPQHMVG